MQTELDILNDKIKNCSLCPRIKNVGEFLTPVIGMGNVNSKIMMIVESPHEEAMVMCEPINIKLQSFLTKYIDINKVYITSLIRCNGDKPPTKSEIFKCKTWLSNEINIIQPSMFILCGEKVESGFTSICEEYGYSIYDREVIFSSHIKIPSLYKIINGSKKDLEEFINKMKNIGILNEQVF